MRQYKGFTWAILQSACAALLALVLVPVYLKFLGLEGYGLIGFFASLQALVVVFDLGLSPTISRETARLTEGEKFEELKTTVTTLEACILSIAAVVGLVMTLSSQAISNHWLQSNNITPSEVTQALVLMAWVLAAKLPTGFYHGILVGAQRLALSSKIQLVFSMLSGFGAILVLAFLSSTIQAFFAWQAVVAFAHLFFVRLQISYVGKNGVSAQFSVSKLREILSFSLPMAGVASTGLIFTQLDRVLLSKLLSLEEFAAYAVAALFASGLHIVVLPVFNSLYPKLVAQVERSRRAEAANDYLLVSSLLIGFLVPVASFLALNAGFLLAVWTGNPVLSAKAAPVLALLLMGYAINGVMYPAYALQLAHGRAKVPLMINIGLAILLAPFLFLSVSRLGVVGAGISWLGVSTVYLLIGSWLTWRLFDLPFAWSAVVKRLIIPATFFLTLTVALAFANPSLVNSLVGIIAIALGTVFCAAVYLGSYAETRNFIRQIVYRS